jgi:hypothetical protein
VSPSERQPSHQLMPKHVLPLLGFVLVCDSPFVRHACRASTPGDMTATVRSVAAKRPTCSDPVVSHHLAGLLRTSGLGFIAPRNRKEFAAFPGFATTFCQPKPTSDGGRFPFLATRFTPFEEFPSPVAVPHHCGRCLLAVLFASPPFRTPKCSTRPLNVPTSAITFASLKAEAARVHLPPRPCADPH